jgi:predicted TIM-barrel fold metal-dependent hydrolase
VLYTSLGFSLFQLPDAGLQEACFRAYNDWLVEFCRYNPKRLYGLALISLYDVQNGVKELQRTAKLGLRGAMIWGSPPEDHDYGDRRYDPFWAAAQELDKPISLHILTGRAKESRIVTGEGRITRYIAFPHEIQRSLATLISTGVLERYPQLKIVSSENDIGWIPHFLYRMDHAWSKFHAMEATKLSLRPSDYFKRQVWGTFQDDPVGVATRHFFGSDRIMWASDYPHTDSTWPHSRKVIAENFAGVPENEIAQMVARNAIILYRMELN